MTTTRSRHRPWQRGTAPRTRPGPPPAARSGPSRRRGHTRPRRRCVVRRTGTPRREARPTRASRTRDCASASSASSTPAKGSRPGKCPREFAAPASRPPRPAGRRAREVLGAPVAVRAMVRAAVETTRTYVPRRRAGSAPPTDEERGVALPPSLGSGVRTANVFGDQRVESQPFFADRSPTRGRRTPPTQCAPRQGSTRPSSILHRKVCTNKDIVRIDHLMVSKLKKQLLRRLLLFSRLQLYTT